MEMYHSRSLNIKTDLWSPVYAEFSMKDAVFLCSASCDTESASS